MAYKVLVTGGAGYIGNHCAAALLSAGREVVVLDDLSRGSRDMVPEGAAFVQASVGDAEAVAACIKEHNIGAVLHFAGFVRVEESVREPELYFKNNTEYSATLLQVAREQGVKHFIFSSTAAVYGTPERVPVAEDAPTRPINPYGESKLRTEGTVREIFSDDANHVILRYFNVAGADSSGKRGYMLEAHPTHLIRAALQVARGAREHLQVFGTDYPTPDGTCVRDYIHVVDLVDAHLKALEHLESGGISGTFNCGYGHGYSVLEVCEAVKRVTGKPLPLQYAPRRAGDPAVIVADSSRIKEVLGWQPQRDNLDTIIADQWRWELSRA